MPAASLLSVRGRTLGGGGGFSSARSAATGGGRLAPHEAQQRRLQPRFVTGDSACARLLIVKRDTAEVCMHHCTRSRADEAADPSRGRESVLLRPRRAARGGRLLGLHQLRAASLERGWRHSTPTRRLSGAVQRAMGAMCCESIHPTYGVLRSICGVPRPRNHPSQRGAACDGATLLMQRGTLRGGRRICCAEHISQTEGASGASNLSRLETSRP